MGSCVKPVGNDTNELDCDNFSSQAEAQAKYDQCADAIASYNDGIDAKKVKSLDLYGLDRDNDGIVCEALSGSPIHATKVGPVLTDESGSTVQPETPEPQKKTPSRSSSSTKPQPKTTPPVYSPTPVLNSDKPFPITEATVRTNPKVLPGQ
jgi:hypothetical protein